MKSRRLIVLGASAFPKIFDVVRRLPDLQVDAIFDDDAKWQGASIEGVPVRGPLTALHDAEWSGHGIVFGIGSSKTRLLRFDILRRLAVPRERWVPLIDPRADVFPTARLGIGCIVDAGVMVCQETVVGDFVLLSHHALVSNDCRLEEGAIIASNSLLTGRVRVGPYAYVGGSSSIREGVRIGAGAQIGLGAVVLHDVPPGATVVGNPAREISRVEVPGEVLALESNS